MRREGRLHGFLRTSALRPGAKVVQLLTSRPTAGVFTRAPSKPTNHSKFTGRYHSQACADVDAISRAKHRGRARGERKAAGRAASALGSEIGRYGEESATDLVFRLVGSWSDDYDDEMQYMYQDLWDPCDDDLGDPCYDDLWDDDLWDDEKFLDYLMKFGLRRTTPADYPVEQQLRDEFADHLVRATDDNFAEQLDRVMRDPGGAVLGAATAAATAADVDDWYLVDP